MVSITTTPAAPGSVDASVGEKKAKSRKPPRRERDRIEYSRFREDALEFAYRFGGYTARQLSELLELRYPDELGSKNPGAKVSPALRAAYRAIESMKRSKLVQKVAVRRGHLAGSEGKVTPEDFVYLSSADSGRARMWAGALCGVEKAQSAREDYRRHQLPKRPEHASWRLDLILLMLRAAREGGVEAPLEEAFGESYPGYPYWLKKPNIDKAGEVLPERRNARAYYDPVIPDGSVSLYGARFDVEVERWTRTGTAGGKGKGVVPKVERHAAYWLRRYERAEEALVREWSASMRAAHGKERPRKTELDAYRASLGWLGLPGEVAPLVIVMRTEAAADGMRSRVRKAYGEGRMPRLAALQAKLGEHGVDVGRLVLYAGWDTLSRSAEPLGREYLPHSWWELYEGDEEAREVDAVSLLDVADEMAQLSADGAED
ncbi:MAG: hypothetical protein M3Q49_07965 [Actinomycetota bacterium]|nr:hypothetical protein [Actinomycetota bacterium]